MASRQEEKERRRKERLERERKEAASAARRKRAQLGGGVLLGLVALAAVVAAVAIGLGGNDKQGAQAPTSDSNAAAKLPAQETSDYQAAAKAAGCKLENPAFEGANHEQKDFKASDYKTNPPTSGNHNPDWYQDGVYVPGSTPRLGMLVHPLEHGRIEVQYKPGTPERTVAQLESLLAEQEQGYHMLMFQNTTNMPYQVAATAWGHLVGCPQMNDKVFDVLRDFRTQYIDQGPEKVD